MASWGEKWNEKKMENSLFGISNPNEDFIIWI